MSLDAGPILEADGLTKRYRDFEALRGVSFRLQAGEIVGLLGPNGAGKTTTLRILAGYLSASAGTARIAGIDVHEDPIAARRRVGYLPEVPPLYRDLTVREGLGFAGNLVGLHGRPLARDVERVASMCGIQSVLDRSIRNLSRGYRQRVGLAQALMGDPDVLILDEPTAGLDPRQIDEVRALVRTLGGRHTVLLSTHVLGEVVATCGRAIILSRGRVVADGPLDDLAGPGGTDAPSLERTFLALTES